MTGPTPRDLKIARAEIDYLAALEAGDLEKLAALWHRAESDPDLTAAFLGLSRDLEAEAAAEQDSAARPADESATGAGTFVPDEFVVAAAAPAFAPPSAADPHAPPRAKDVARRVKEEAAAGKLELSPQDAAAVDSLLDRDDPLPDLLAMPAVKRWTESLGVAVGKATLLAFRDAAITLSFTRSETAAGPPPTANFLAAREARPASGRARQAPADPQSPGGPREKSGDAPETEPPPEAT